MDPFTAYTEVLEILLEMYTLVVSCRESLCSFVDTNEVVSSN